MRGLTVVFLAFLALTSAIPRTRKLRDSTRIVSGSEATVGQIPWQVSFQTTGTFGRHFCGGSVLNENWILDAGHCVGNTGSTDNPSGYQIETGILRVREDEAGGQVVAVDAIIRHQRYNLDGLYSNDISLLKLVSPLTFDLRTSAIALPALQPYGGDDVHVQGDFADTYPTLPDDCNGGNHFFVSGWGTTTAGGSTPDVLLYTGVCYVTDSVCNDPPPPATSLSGYGGDVIESMICAGGAGGNHDSCQGDSGGPMTLSTTSTLTTSENEQIGIVSWGSGCARDGKPGVYTQVSFFVDWINFATSCYNGSNADDCSCDNSIQSC